jgi:hypothetical protein
MKYTNIQWCHSTVNPVMGCDGCELWMAGAAFVPDLCKIAAWAGCNTPEARSEVAKILCGRTASELYRDRKLWPMRWICDCNLALWLVVPSWI